MRILVIRFSAMGDVALSVPVLKSFTEKYPEHKVYLLTNKAFNSLFFDIPNITFINPDFKNKNKGIKGLFILYREIKKEINPEIVADIHNVLRSKIIRIFFALSGIKTYKINKERSKKRKLTRKKNKILTHLKHTTERYKDVFTKAGFNFELKCFKKKYSEKDRDILNFINPDKKNIGIAPFAKHPQKQYPLEKTEELIKLLTENGYNILLFGGGEKEKKFAGNLEKKYKNTTSVIGKLSLSKEIELIDNLDIIITPDSGNMHLAALTSVKIISIWGATHPFAGFTPFVPPEQNFIIQNEKLNCRPCSVFGNKKCYKNTLECLNSINPSEIFELCKKILRK